MELLLLLIDLFSSLDRSTDWKKKKKTVELFGSKGHFSRGLIKDLNVELWEHWIIYWFSYQKVINYSTKWRDGTKFRILSSPKWKELNNLDIYVQFIYIWVRLIKCPLECSGKQCSINSCERGGLTLFFHLKHQVAGYSGVELLVSCIELLFKHKL